MEPFTLHFHQQLVISLYQEVSSQHVKAIITGCTVYYSQEPNFVEWFWQISLYLDVQPHRLSLILKRAIDVAL